MAQLTDDQLRLLQALETEGIGLIIGRTRHPEYQPLEDMGYVKIDLFSPTQIRCKLTAEGRAVLTSFKY